MEVEGENLEGFLLRQKFQGFLVCVFKQLFLVLNNILRISMYFFTH